MIPSVHIVTGGLNTGKTARMKELFHQTAAADGIVSEKIFDGEGCCGYRLVHLRDGEAMELALNDAAYHGQFTQACRLGPFVFSAEAFSFGARLLERSCADPSVGSIFLDEAGPLELSGQGFAGTLPLLFHSGKELYITVRAGCLQAFLQSYGIAQYHLVPVP